jgi:acetyl-CoA carboxylase biotin carboxyl carrier protein
MAKRKTVPHVKAAPAAAPKAAAASKATGAVGQDKLYTDQVRVLVDLMVANDLTSLEIANGDLRVALGRGQGAFMAAAPAALPAAAPTGSSPAAAKAASALAQSPAVAAEVIEKFVEIKSPMVGTFYAAPSPDSDPYVSAGTRITADTVVCIIEAMKVMNEIKAECSGTLVEVVVENGRPVEYGQVLFKVRP